MEKSKYYSLTINLLWIKPIKRGPYIFLINLTRKFNKIN